MINTFDLLLNIPYLALFILTILGPLVASFRYISYILHNLEQFYIHTRVYYIMFLL